MEPVAYIWIVGRVLGVHLGQDVEGVAPALLEEAAGV